MKKALKVVLTLGGMIISYYIVVFGYILYHIPDEQEDIESGFHPDFNIVQKNVRQNPHNPDYKLPYAMALYDKKMYVKALAELEPLLKRDKPQPNDMTIQPSVYLYAGKILIGMDKYEQAKVYLRELVKVFPPEPDITYSMGNAAQELLNSIR